MQALAPTITSAVVRDGLPAGEYISPVVEVSGTILGKVDVTPTRFVWPIVPVVEQKVPAFQGTSVLNRTDFIEANKEVRGMVLRGTRDVKISLWTSSDVIRVTNGMAIVVDTTPQTVNFQNTQHATVIDMQPREHGRSHTFVSENIPVRHIYEKNFNANTTEILGYVSSSTRSIRQTSYEIVESMIFNMNRIYIRIPAMITGIVYTPPRVVETDPIMTEGGCSGSIKETSLLELLSTEQRTTLDLAINGEKNIGFPILPTTIDISKIKLNVCSKN